MDRYFCKYTNKKIYSFKEVETWSLEEKKTYYNSLRDKCVKNKQKTTGCSWLIAKLAPILRNFPIEIRGEENILEVPYAVFVGNHSNSHDVFVIKEIFSWCKKPVTILTAWDGLNMLSRISFYLGNATFIKRTEKSSIEKGILRFCSKILNDTNGFIFGEAT